MSRNLIGQFRVGILTMVALSACLQNISAQSVTSADQQWPESVAIRGYVDGVPVYGFGETYVYGVSPDFTAGPDIQEGNSEPRTKIKPKKSWEIESNMLGATPPRVPRTATNDFQPFLALNLIDGDLDTAWSSRGQSQPNVEPAWVRLDLPIETPVKEIVLVPRKGHPELAKELSVRVSRDAWHWDTAYTSANFVLPTNAGRFSISLHAKPVKQIWVVANGLPSNEFGHTFCLAEIEVLDENGRNIALASKGTGVTVSSVNYGTPSSRELHEALWPTHYDLGIKWIRVAYWDSTLNWHFVERQKGKYEIDPRSDASITEAADKGLNVILCLAYGNWLYTDTFPRKRAKQIWEVPFDMAPAPTSGAMGNSTAMLEGYKNFVRFMVRHFKDRVRYYEIYNEEDAVELWNGKGRTQLEGKTSDPREFSRLVKEVAPLIHQEDPEAKVLLGSVSPHRLYLPDGLGTGFLQDCLRQGVGPLVDIIAWHPFYSLDPDTPEYRTYPAQVEAFKRLASSYGFRGQFMATELLWRAPYPAASGEQGYVKGSGYMYGPVSEVVKAKYLARVMLLHTALGMVSLWNETWADGQVPADATLFRNTFSAPTIDPQQPQPAYYVLRTLSTILENASPSELPVAVTQKIDKLRIFGFTNKAGDNLVAIWNDGRAQDHTEINLTDVQIPGPCRAAVGMDTLNGFAQALSVAQQGDKCVIKNIAVRDYPIVIRLSGVEKHDQGVDRR